MRWLHCLAMVLFVSVFSVHGKLLAAEPKLDRFGGWTGLNFEATGFFRLEEQNGKTWFVSPEGNAFLANQLDHVAPYYLVNDYNKEHWAREFGIPVDSEMAEFIPGFWKKVKSDQEVIGFNSTYHTLEPEPGKAFVPYVGTFKNLEISYWMWHPEPEMFKDVFSDDFVRECEEAAEKKVKPRANDPYLLAWYFTDSPTLSEFEARPFNAGHHHTKLYQVITYPQRLRNLGPETAGKQAYVELMQERHGTISSFNGTYATDFESWQGLLEAADWKLSNDYYGDLAKEEDNFAFMLKILDRAYSVQVAAVRKYDKNHLIFGDTLNCNAPLIKEERYNEVLKVFGRHFDVLYFQFYGTWDSFEPLIKRLYQESGLPVFSADSCFSVPYQEMPHPVGVHCANHEVRTEQFKECYYNAFAIPYFVGWGWCGWVDSWSKRAAAQHSGLQDPFGNFNEPLVSAMKQFSQEMYGLHLTGINP